MTNDAEQKSAGPVNIAELGEAADALDRGMAWFRDGAKVRAAADEIKRLRGIEEVARKLVYVAAPPVSPVRLALALPALCDALGIDPIEAAAKATADEEAAKQRAASRE